MQRDFYMPLEVIKDKLNSREYKKFLTDMKNLLKIFSLNWEKNTKQALNQNYIQFELSKN